MGRDRIKKGSLSQIKKKITNKSPIYQTELKNQNPEIHNWKHQITETCWVPAGHQHYLNTVMHLKGNLPVHHFSLLWDSPYRAAAFLSATLNPAVSLELPVEKPKRFGLNFFKMS